LASRRCFAALSQVTEIPAVNGTGQSTNNTP
jgi:hypothetical protein